MAIRLRFGDHWQGRFPRSGEIVGLRPFEAGDETELAKIYLDCRREVFAWMEADAFALDDFARDTSGERITVAESGGRPIGFVSVWEPDHFVHHLYVAGPQRRLGIGRRLLEAAVRDSHGGACRLKCQSANAGALAFYESLGWRAIGDGRDSIGRWILMESPAPQGEWDTPA